MASFLRTLMPPFFFAMMPPLLQPLLLFEAADAFLFIYYVISFSFEIFRF